MTSPKTAEVRSAPDQDHGEWLQVTPGERFKIRVPSAQTMSAYSMIEIVADSGNGVPLHIHNEDEHFIVLEGTLDIANGDRRSDDMRGDLGMTRSEIENAVRRPRAMSERSSRA